MGKGGASAGTGSTFLGAVSASCFAYRFAVRFFIGDEKRNTSFLLLYEMVIRFKREIVTSIQFTIKDNDK